MGITNVVDINYKGFEGSITKIELRDQGRNVVYIPMTNVALIEYFDSMHDFEKAYPKGNGWGY